MRYLKFITFLSVLCVFFYACQEDAHSGPHFIFKDLSSKGIVTKIKGTKYTDTEVFKGHEGEIFEAEMKVFEIKMNLVRSFLLERLMKTHPGKKGLSNDDFLEKYISKGKSPSQKEIADFIKKRNIPKQHVNDQMKDRIKKYLHMEMQKELVESWLTEQTAKTPVEV